MTVHTVFVFCIQSLLATLVILAGLYMLFAGMAWLIDKSTWWSLSIAATVFLSPFGAVAVGLWRERDR